MFKAVLLGQWHSLSDPELEHSLITRIDFNLFCRFDELIIPITVPYAATATGWRKTTPCPNYSN
ncbi:hypothetical protein NX89_11155 [Neisseria meningitidis]|nr:hypothetical protein NX89_11155 [Neisseria meningitidis]